MTSQTSLPASVSSRVNWKFSSDDLKSRAKWDEFQAAYEEMMEKTSTEYAPWYVVPADKKFFARVAIGEIIVEHLKKLDLQYPAGETSGELQKAKEMLMNEV